MGCFDTFIGSVKCPHCNDDIHFEKQTKNYDCFLSDFKVGDYIDKGNTNYFYSFKYPCQQCKKDIEIHAAIRNGQLINFFTDIENLDIFSLENIEEGYQRNIEYNMMCFSGYGFDTSLYKKDKFYHVGDTITTLKRDWVVEKVFEERVNQNEENEGVLRFCNLMFRNNRCYLVHDEKGNKRLIITREKQPTYITDSTDNVSDHPYSKYNKQLGTDLIELS